MWVALKYQMRNNWESITMQKCMEELIKCLQARGIIYNVCNVAAALASLRPTVIMLIISFNTIDAAWLRSTKLTHIFHYSCHLILTCVSERNSIDTRHKKTDLQVCFLVTCINLPLSDTYQHQAAFHINLICHFSLSCHRICCHSTLDCLPLGHGILAWDILDSQSVSVFLLEITSKWNTCLFQLLSCKSPLNLPKQSLLLGDTSKMGSHSITQKKGCMLFLDCIYW